MKKFYFIAFILALAILINLSSAFASPEDLMGQVLSDFSVNTINDTSFTISESLKTHDLVLINFWATWCGPCGMEFPYLEEAWKKYADRVDVIALSIEKTDSNEKLTEYANEYGLSFQIGRDDSGLFDNMKGTAIPTTLIVDKNMRVVAVEIGSKSSVEDFTRLFDSLLLSITTRSETSSWDCPGCGRTGNIGNYCGNCSYPSPWVESAQSVEDKNEDDKLTIERSQEYGKHCYVAAGDYYAVAVKKDGTCFYTKHAPNIAKWKDIVYICSSKDQVAAIKKDGKVVCSDSSMKVSKWSNIEKIEYASNNFSDDQHLVALTKDGKVLATGTNQYGECNTEKWQNIVDVSAGYLHTVALCADGTVLAVGNNSSGQCDVQEWTDIVDVAAARFSTYGLKSNGQIVVAGHKMADEGNKVKASVPNWENVVAIIADNEGGTASDYVIGILEDGTIVSNRESYVSTAEIRSFTNVVSVGCASWGYTIISDSKGKVFDIGWDADGARITDEWSGVKTND